MKLPATWEYSAHPKLQAVKAILENRFGPRLNILPSSTDEWLTFQVVGLTDEVLIRTLEREHQEYFGTEMDHFQVVKQLDGGQPGVSIRYLRGGALSGDPGFWYY